MQTQRKTWSLLLVQQHSTVTHHHHRVPGAAAAGQERKAALAQGTNPVQWSEHLSSLGDNPAGHGKY